MLVYGIPSNATYDFAADVRAGLLRTGQKELPSKDLYDDVGSALFEVISRLPEYGHTRADERLLRRYADEIVERLAGRVAVAELGSGSGRKTRWLLEPFCRRQRTPYYPVEISRSALVMCERELSDIDAISIVGLEREYLDGRLEVTSYRKGGQRLFVLFLVQHDWELRPPSRSEVSGSSPKHSSAGRRSPPRSGPGKIQRATARSLRRRTRRDRCV